ncbi:MAG: M20 family metallopeptidase [Chloroflexi bacterium]|nr:MAG: M20 family metallopeptidase [Chloroflexota bacterium]
MRRPGSYPTRAHGLWHSRGRMQRSARAILERLVRIPSPTGEERAAAEACASLCSEAGLEVVLEDVSPGRPNVVARWKVGRHPHVLLTGHLDTVPVGEGWTVDPFGAEVGEGRLYGRGACDMKGGLAAMLSAMVDMRRRGEEPAGDVTLAAVVGEEEDSAGTRALVARGIQADSAVLAEPTAMQLVVSNRGLLNFRIVVKGASAHASSPALGRNAVTAAAAIVLELESIGEQLARQPHPEFGPPSLTVGTIHGGTRPYVVPDRCVIEVDRRINRGETAEQAVGELETAIALTRKRLPWLEADVVSGSDYLPFEIPQDHELVRSMSAAMSAAGLPRQVSAWRAASDAGFLVHGAGIPCVLFGPGDIEQAAHRPDEWIDLDDLDTAQRVFEHLLLGRQSAKEVADGSVSR